MSTMPTVLSISVGLSQSLICSSNQSNSTEYKALAMASLQQSTQKRNMYFYIKSLNKFKGTPVYIQITLLVMGSSTHSAKSSTGATTKYKTITTDDVIVRDRFISAWPWRECTFLTENLHYNQGVTHLKDKLKEAFK